MQWIALDHNRSITAAEAEKKKTYQCPECSSPVRLRSGPHRQAHFYHLHSSSKCYQHKKSDEHLGLQILLASGIASDEVRIERPFPEIKRIADIAWEKRKIIFEIQCSPITEQEVRNRNEDYQSIGWKLIWILSDKKFNKRKLSAAEAVLRLQTCYFSQWQNRKVYDQCEILIGFYRKYKGAKIEINPLRVINHDPQETPSFPLPASLKNRWDSWELRTEGDVLSRIHSKERHLAYTLYTIEQRLYNQAPGEPHLPWLILLKKCYLFILNKILTYLASD